MVRELSTAKAPVVAAGAVLWRMRDGQLQVCVIHRPKYDDWTLPKGKAEDGEHILTAAVREVAEETGHHVTLGRSLPTQRYLVGARPKVVRYWAAHAPVDGPAWEPNSEVDRVDFLPVGDAGAQLSYAHDAELVASLAGGPLQTSPLVLLRHAKSVSRGDWSGPDDARPLDAGGYAAANRLAAILSAYGRLRVLSSDAVRCTESIRPYAENHDSLIETRHELSEAGRQPGSSAGSALVQDLLAAGSPAVVCSHRPVLPELLAAATARTRVPVPTEPLPPSSFHVLHHRDGVVVDIETHTV